MISHRRAELRSPESTSTWRCSDEESPDMPLVRADLDRGISYQCGPRTNA